MALVPITRRGAYEIVGLIGAVERNWRLAKLWLLRAMDGELG